MNTNLNPQTEDEDIMKATFDVADAERAWSKTYFMSVGVQNIAFLAIQAFLLINYKMTSQVLGLKSPSISWLLVWLFVLFVVNIFVGMIVSAIGHSLFYKYTGKIYVKNRMDYARAGGYDIARLHALIAQIVVFGIYWWTYQLNLDPLAAVRNGLSFVLSCGVVSIVVSAILFNLLFSLYSRLSAK